MGRPVQAVLHKYEPKLQAIFEAFSAADKSMAARDATATMSMAEWEAMLKAGRLVDRNFTAREATQCFVKVNLTDEIFVSNKEGDTEMECTYDEFATMVARMARAKTSKGGAGIDTTGDGKADTVLGQMAVDTTGDGHADTVLETPFEVTLDSWLGLYFVPSFMEMLKKAKKSGGLSFN